MSKKGSGFTMDMLLQRIQANPHLSERNPGVLASRVSPSPAPQQGLAPDLTKKPGSDSPRDREGAKSQGEREMWGMLEKQLREGVIHSFAYEAITIQVGTPRCKYTPDFAVWRHDGTLLLIEVKGKKKWEDSLIKFKSARLQYPKIAFQMWERDGGDWREIYPE